MPNKSFIDLKKNKIQGNLVWNIHQNFHEDRLIIQDRSMYQDFGCPEFAILFQICSQ